LSNDLLVPAKSVRKLAGTKSSANGEVNSNAMETAAGDLLEFFYPIHYKAGMALEDAMRRGRLTRTQVAILWLIRAEGEAGTFMRRKDIERRIRLLFEITSSAITKAIRGMARAPLSLVSVVEDPHSAREKRVVLTSKGKRFQSAMLAEGRSFLQGIIGELAAEDVKHGIRFLRLATAALEASERVQQRSNNRRDPGESALMIRK
jgi:DNA-binding MarR family transcriptional regulator